MRPPAEKPPSDSLPLSSDPASPRVRFRMRVMLADRIALGPGKIDLLEAIRASGSISGAARDLGMSYRRAWLLLDEVNRSLTSPAALSAHGGSSRGGCVLTPVGEEIVRLYRDIEHQAHAHCATQIDALSALIDSSSVAKDT